MNRRTLSHFTGCLLGGAVGDALGWPVEFMSWEEIKNRYGGEGIRDPDLKGNPYAEITDDTQMTLFTAEGLLRAKCRIVEKGICYVPGVIHHAYLRWLKTQGGESALEIGTDGWLLGVEALHAQRAPGNACLSSLMRSRNFGDMARNDSKGCGGVMRMAPVGLIMGLESVFDTASEAAGLTHGHPTGRIAAAAFAVLINGLVAGQGLAEAVESVMKTLGGREDSQETAAALKNAVRLAKSGKPAVEKVHSLGGGWVAEEALAIAVYAALSYPDSFKDAVILAVNHSGDSDSTGAICGNVMGLMHGEEGIPAEWVRQVELQDVIRTMACDLYTGYENTDEWREKYPGW